MTESNKKQIWWLVLPPLIIVMMISAIDSLLLNDLIETRYAMFYKSNTTTKSIQRSMCLNSSHISDIPSQYYLTTTVSPAASDQAQSATAKLNIVISLSATVPTIFSSIILGSNCDTIGRRVLITLPFIGKLLRYVIMTAVNIWNLSNIFIIISVILDGIFGTSALTILSAFAFVTDCTTLKQRTSAIIITDVSITMARVVALVGLGYYLKYYGYLIPSCVTLGLSTLGLVYSLLFQRESNQTVDHLNIFQQLKLIRLTPIFKVLQVFTIERKSNKRKILLLTVFTHLSIIVMIYGSFSVTYLYLYGQPFCWGSYNIPNLFPLNDYVKTESHTWEVSLNSSAQAILVLLLTIVFTLTITSDSFLIPMTGVITFMIQLVLFGIARSTWLLYLGVKEESLFSIKQLKLTLFFFAAVCIGAVFRVTCGVLRSRITKVVEPNEYAVVFVFAGIFESAGSYALSAMCNAIYNATIHTDPGFVFVVIAGVGILPLLTMG
ncbi:unnamed protein product [Didymodactylos carnosus]|uniref:Uncharacterized protein n=1 Tax=Didymodactylos carnosus TaxID=1234261 RepID=A0A814AF33_9BILA|nr:unnamed protein product [Didymodactylos carnosus]CAF3693455.1 unnamed protein product [Didymodactylos carnosus]